MKTLKRWLHSFLECGCQLSVPTETVEVNRGHAMNIESRWDRRMCDLCDRTLFSPPSRATSPQVAKKVVFLGGRGAASSYQAAASGRLLTCWLYAERKRKEKKVCVRVWGASPAELQ